MRKWSARVFAVLALLAVPAAVYVAVTSVESDDEVTVEEAQAAMTRLTEANRSLSGRLRGLRPPISPKPALEAVRTAVDLSHALGDEVEGGGNLRDRLDEVLAAELAYLDAIGSTLNNPRSALRDDIQERGIALRQVLQSIPGGMPKMIRGGSNLVVYSIARVRGAG